MLVLFVRNCYIRYCKSSIICYNDIIIIIAQKGGAISTDPNDMYYSVLSDKVRYFKEDEKGESKMCKVLEEMKDEAEKRAEERMKVQFANFLLDDGEMPIEKIAKVARLTIDRVRELAAQKTVPNS